jgi:hypothetical protein
MKGHLRWEWAMRWNKGIIISLAFAFLNSTF